MQRDTREYYLDLIRSSQSDCIHLHTKVEIDHNVIDPDDTLQIENAINHVNHKNQRKDERVPVAVTPEDDEFPQYAHELGKNAIANSFVMNFMTIDMSCATDSHRNAEQTAARIRQLIGSEGMLLALLIEDGVHGPLTGEQNELRETVLQPITELGIPALSVLPKLSVGQGQCAEISSSDHAAQNLVSAQTTVAQVV